MTPGSFGRFMRAQRTEAGVALPALAKHLGYSVAYLSEVERGRRNPLCTAACIKMARYLQTSPEDFLERAALEREHVQLSLVDARPEAYKTALLLARRWPALTKTQLHALQKILEAG